MFVIGSICALNSVLSTFPSINTSELVYSTSSGGTIGVGLMGEHALDLVSRIQVVAAANVAWEMSIPSYTAIMTYETANTQAPSSTAHHLLTVQIR